MPDADNRYRHFLLDQMFQILGKNVPVADAINAGPIGSAVTAHVTGQDVKIINKMSNKRGIGARTKTVTV